MSFVVLVALLPKRTLFLEKVKTNKKRPTQTATGKSDFHARKGREIAIFTKLKKPLIKQEKLADF